MFLLFKNPVEMEIVKRLDATQKALDLIDMLESKFGPLMFYQAGGCCEGTQPQCFELLPVSETAQQHF